MSTASVAEGDARLPASWSVPTGRILGEREPERSFCSAKVVAHRNGSARFDTMGLSQAKAHVYLFPPGNAARRNGRKTVMCIPQKNGNRNWAALFYRLWLGNAPQQPLGAGGSFLNGQRPGAGKWEPKSPKEALTDVHTLLVARNPYTRVLSYYLDKVQPCTRFSTVKNPKLVPGQQCARIYPFLSTVKEQAVSCGSSRNWNCTTSYMRNMDFRDFLFRLAKRLSYAPDLCVVDHHLCAQTSICVMPPSGRKASLVTALKLEEQGQWFPCFVRRMGISERSLLGPEWRAYAGRDCYFTPTKDCADAFVSQTTITRESRASGTDDRVTGITAATNRGAQQLQRHYSRVTAKLVSEIYADDLRELGYDPWDGKTKSRGYPLAVARTTIPKAAGALGAKPKVKCLGRTRSVVIRDAADAAMGQR